MTREEIERTVYEAIEASQPVGPESAPAYFRRCDALAKKATDLILSDRAGEGGGERRETCPRCQGNGEIVTDWDRYRQPHDGDKGDEAVAECPDCCGEAWQELLDKDDRTSPEEYPELALITRDELRDFMGRAVPQSEASLALESIRQIALDGPENYNLAGRLARVGDIAASALTPHPSREGEE